MAKKTPQPPASDPELRVSHEEATRRISERIALGEELLKRQLQGAEQLEEASNERDRWNNYNAELLKRLFTTHKFADDYLSWAGMFAVGGSYSWQEKLQAHREDLRDRINRLNTVHDCIELVPVAGDIRPTALSVGRPKRTNKIFVVHGHDEGARESIARFLEKLGLQAIILHEQASAGKTIVEKLEHYAGVDFAVVLLTPDDVGGPKMATGSDLKPRARQNVVLELGLFVGKLGRDKVCALYKGGQLELPSDYLGVVYVALDDGDGWRLRLARELRTAGFDVDMNLAL